MSECPEPVIGTETEYGILPAGSPQLRGDDITRLCAFLIAETATPLFR